MLEIWMFISECKNDDLLKYYCKGFEFIYKEQFLLF